jgi:hypothetical protein
MICDAGAYLLPVFAHCVCMLLSSLGQSCQGAHLPAPVEGGSGILQGINISKGTCKKHVTYAGPRKVLMN